MIPHIRFALILLLPLLLLAACQSSSQLKAFTTDGCSSFPNGTLSHKELWLECCTEHDRAYWLGGTYSQRRDADKQLRECVAQVGEPAIANLMLGGVRVGGTPILPTRFRWGYGWDYPRWYGPLSEAEGRLIKNTIQEEQ
ncbi:MAG: hypothetical protein ABFS09_04925 [Thermodesulfobacteriota bacterium]